eukprot:6191389-Pleurochrysis_carterae.AAC.1
MHIPVPCRMCVNALEIINCKCNSLLDLNCIYDPVVCGVSKHVCHSDKQLAKLVFQPPLRIEDHKRLRRKHG